MKFEKLGKKLGLTLTIIAIVSSSLCFAEGPQLKEIDDEGHMIYTIEYDENQEIEKQEKQVEKIMEEKMIEINNEDVDNYGTKGNGKEVWNDRAMDMVIGKDGVVTSAMACNYNARVTDSGQLFGKYRMNVDTGGGQHVTTDGPKPDKVVLNQDITFNLLKPNYSISLSGPGVSVGDGQNSYSWQSRAITSNTKDVLATHAQIGAETFGVISSVEMQDIADVYVGGRVYRPTSYKKFRLSYK